MRRRSDVRTVILSIGLIGGLALLALAVQADAAKPLRQAATGPSPEETQLKQLPAPAQQVGRPSKAELLGRCQQRPACRAKLDMAQKGQKPAIIRPAATSPSPEELDLRKLPPPATPVMPRRFQRSELDLGPWDRLLAWLNPFHPPVAEAQSAVSVLLTPQNRYVASPYSSLSLYGVGYWGSYYLSSSFSTVTPSAENKPFAWTVFVAPAPGWYIIDVRAGSAAAKLRHQSGGSIIETWDVGSVPCSGGVCDYATMEYLQQGGHSFYFYSPTSHYYFYSVSIESYP
jgi:hypothetical protein